MPTSQVKHAFKKNSRSQWQSVQREVVSGAERSIVQRVGRRHRPSVGLRAAGVSEDPSRAQGARARTLLEPRLPAHLDFRLVGLQHSRLGRPQRKVPRRRKRTRRRRLWYKNIEIRHFTLCFLNRNKCESDSAFADGFQFSGLDCKTVEFGAAGASYHNDAASAEKSSGRAFYSR